MFRDHAEALAAVRAHYELHRTTAEKCQLGDLIITKPDGLEPRPGLLWVMGFNGGETPGQKDAAGHTRSARRWFRFCTEAATAAGTDGCIIGERTHWGSPNVAELVARVGSQERMRDLLRFHAEVNRALLRDYRPAVVWLTGLSCYFREAVKDYGLTSKEESGLRDRRGWRLWEAYQDDSGVPWLATIHPTGARMSGAEFERVKEKLAEMTGATRSLVAEG